MGCVSSAERGTAADQTDCALEGWPVWPDAALSSVRKNRHLKSADWMIRSISLEEETEDGTSEMIYWQRTFSPLNHDPPNFNQFIILIENNHLGDWSPQMNGRWRLTLQMTDA